MTIKTPHHQSQRFLGDNGNVWADDRRMRRAWRVFCCECKATKAIPLHRDRSVPPDIIMKWFRQAGWHIDRRSSGDLCPHHAKRKTNGAAPNAPLEAAAPQQQRAATEEAPATAAPQAQQQQAGAADRLTLPQGTVIRLHDNDTERFFSLVIAIARECHFRDQGPFVKEEQAARMIDRAWSDDALRADIDKVASILREVVVAFRDEAFYQVALANEGEFFIVTAPGLTPLQEHQILTKAEYVKAARKFGDHFTAAQVSNRPATPGAPQRTIHEENETSRLNQAFIAKLRDRIKPHLD
jgi:hypothetical protein